jgi:elongation of very long chain fatty acids protein 6
MAEHYEVPTVLMCCYIALVWQVQEKMKLRPAFNLSRVTVAWNWGLSIFSAVGFAHVSRAFVTSGSEHGFAGEGSVLCRRDVQFDNQWVALFCLSKIPELVDTALLVLQKKPVIFLHWYHHAVTLLYCWIAWVRIAPNGALFALMNLFVHTIMCAHPPIPSPTIFL